jgi:Iap family predicted aminopeptidase
MDECDRITDDSLVYLSGGIPAVTIGNSGLPGKGLAGFHTTKDAVSRVDYKNIALVQTLLKQYIESYRIDGRK